MIPSLLRRLVFPLVSFRPTYLVGMVLVRLSRSLKNRTYKEREELTTIGNCLGSLKMRVDKNSYMGGSIYWCGLHHVSELLYLRQFLKDDMVFVDVGANQGEFALFACSRLPKGKVLAFEPTPYQLGLLKTNVGLNHFQNIEVLEYGLFDQPGKLNMYTSDDTSVHSGRNEGLSSLYPSEDRNKIEGSIDLKVFDDEFGNSLSRLDIVKIDVEGAELAVLRGMKGALSKFKPTLILEMNKLTFEQAGYAYTDVLDFLRELGYLPYKLYRGRVYPIAESVIPDYCNTVFIADRRD